MLKLWKVEKLTNQECQKWSLDINLFKEFNKILKKVLLKK